MQLGQLSSAILEFETILQRHPEDRDAMAAMAQIESKANNLTKPPPMEVEPSPIKSTATTLAREGRRQGSARTRKWMTDGRRCTRFLWRAS